MIIKKIDINSIFPIIIKRIILNFEDVSKFAKFISLIPYIADDVVFVIVSIDNLNDFSKLILSTVKIPDKIKRLIKKDMNIKKDILILSSDIFFSDLKIVLFIILLGLINLIISNEVIFNNI